MRHASPTTRTGAAARPARPASRARARVLGGAIALLLTATPTVAAAAVTPGTVDVTLTGTLEQVVVDHPADGPGAATEKDGHEHDHAGELVLDSMVEVGGVLHDVPEHALAASTSLRSGDPVQVLVRVPRDTDAVEAMTDAGADGGTTPDARVLRVSAAPGTTAAPTATASTTTLGSHTLTVLPVHWGYPDSVSRARLTEVAGAASTYWSEQSGGRLTLAPSVRDWKRIADPGSCDTAAIMQAALAAHGVGRATMTAHVAVYFPPRADCRGWAGMGSIRGGSIWINGVPTVDVLAHELGHNLGLGHANTVTCTAGGARTPLAVDEDCTVSPYADLADVMGFGTDMPTGNLNSALADHLGFAEVVEVTSLPATIDLARLSDVHAVRAVKLPTALGTVYVDFRPAQGRDVRRTAWAGVQVHRVVGGTYPETQLLDMQPSATRAFSAPSLPVGGSWDLPGTGQTLTVTAVGTTSARVSVRATGSTTPAPTPAPVTLGRDLTFVPVAPTRLLDTRDTAAPLGAGERRDVVVAGTRGIPSGARAVALNLTAVDPTTVTHLSAWPAGSAMPTSSVLNTDPHRVVASGVMLGTGAGGAVSVSNASGRVHLVVDVTGYYVESGGSGFESLRTPHRVLDTRTGLGAVAGRLTDGTSRTVQLAGKDGVPADATAVVVNVTSVEPADGGFLVAHPAGTARPLASTVNHQPGGVATNRATVQLADGAMTVALHGAAADVVVDVVGWFGPGGSGRFTPVTPVRAFDTRTAGTAMRGGEARALDVRAAAGAPAGARTAVMVLTATQAVADTYVTAWDGAWARPGTSDLNVRAGQNTANLSLVPWSATGDLRLYNNTSTVHVIGDVLGWFS